MKSLAVFVFCVLTYSVVTMFQAKTNASVYRAGIAVLIDNAAIEVNRKPAIVPNTRRVYENVKQVNGVKVNQ
jgi:hypothetical protein